jgi:hypothetical protein
MARRATGKPRILMEPSIPSIPSFPSFSSAVVALDHHPYAYMSIRFKVDEDAICLYTYNREHVQIGSAKIQTLNQEPIGISKATEDPADCS